MQLHKSIALSIFSIFLILGTLTLPRYGINWDTINHLPRGQAYLHYFLTGERNYSRLAPWKEYWQDPDSLLIKSDKPVKEINTRSMYKSDATTMNWFMERDGNGHPPLSDILSSFFNIILFEKLKLINDIDAYRVYGVFLASSLTAFVYIFVAKRYGWVSGLTSSLSLAIYPLFWSELHFNTEKDVPETVFISLMIFSIYIGVSKAKRNWIYLSGVFFGLALGTKFNVLFLIFVLAPWLILNRHLIFKNKRLLVYMCLVPVIGLVIFFMSWPYLWLDPISGFLKVLGFYKGIGTSSSIDTRFIGPLGINTYPLLWILYTTPEVILMFFLIGLFYLFFRNKKDPYKLKILLALWFGVPVIRVTWPGTHIYGGVRQIMEYIPAMAIISGIGAGYLYNVLNKKLPKTISLFILAIPIFFTGKELYEIHPNENVYFNRLIGGLSGAKEQNMPSWGNSFGAAYRQGVSYINKNAYSGAKVVLVYELLPNIPKIFFRRDIEFHNSYRSGYLQKGEYALTLVYEGVKARSYYDLYLEKFVKPVYEVKVDNVAILKVWKNSPEFLRTALEEKQAVGVTKELTANGLLFTLKNPEKLSRLELKYSESPGCSELQSAYIRISEDKVNWDILYGNLPKDWLIPVIGSQPKEGEFIEPFVGQSAKYVEIVMSPSDACFKKVTSFKLLVL